MIFNRYTAYALNALSLLVDNISVGVLQDVVLRYSNSISIKLMCNVTYSYDPKDFRNGAEISAQIHSNIRNCFNNLYRINEAMVKNHRNLKCYKWAVTLSKEEIPTEGIRRFLYDPSWCLVIVKIGDISKFKISTTLGSNIIVIDEAEQKSISSQFVKDLPPSARRNVGYLFAIANDAKMIFDFDVMNEIKFWMPNALPSDNFASLNHFENPKTSDYVSLKLNDTIPDCPIYDPYANQSNPIIRTKYRIPSNCKSFKNNFLINNSSNKKINIGVIHSKLDHFKSDQDFKVKKSKAGLLLPKGIFYPYGTESSIYYPSMFWSLYIPSSVNEGESEVLRCYIVKFLCDFFNIDMGFVYQPLTWSSGFPIGSLRTQSNGMVHKIVSHSTIVSQKDIEINADYYAKNPIAVDGFFCEFPASMCEIWIPLKKSIIFLPAHRYNLGRCSISDWKRLNKNLADLDRKKNFIGALSRYDLEYMDHYTNLSPTLFPSYSGVYLRISNSNLKMPNDTEHCKDQTLHAGGFKFYNMGIPLLMPSLRRFYRENDFGEDRTSTSSNYCKDTNLNTFPSDPESAHPFNPNLRKSEDLDSETYWLQFSDFYDWPYVLLFDNVSHLHHLIDHTNFPSISSLMLQEVQIRKEQTYNAWCNVINQM
ncbi:unnamed protein product [Lepeophtheirus salmonis]|uniref:(salmon louse) hypothetical protein n=1 Tax=Lepeophtheirus salmonis TaxID=72036 RepID=A0A7R8H0G6_LEPSM|nr:unnamed protein product [Lepeophtheirus salmonis]CAF2783821.1 unnamed protein product [Lepeophtheirus salmonis]